MGYFGAGFRRRGKRNQMRVRGMVEGDGRSRETRGKMTKIS